jgi:hypothetical protein
MSYVVDYEGLDGRIGRAFVTPLYNRSLSFWRGGEVRQTETFWTIPPSFCASPGALDHIWDDIRGEITLWGMTWPSFYFRNYDTKNYFVLFLQRIDPYLFQSSLILNSHSLSLPLMPPLDRSPSPGRFAVK